MPILQVEKAVYLPFKSTLNITFSLFFFSLKERSSRSITGFLKNHRILILGLMVILVIVVIVTSCNRYTEHQMTTAGYPTTSNMSPTWHPPTISSSPPNNTLHPTTLSSVDTTSKLGNGTQQSPTSTFHTRNISLSP
ncbi:hypothetical protein XELAEV_18001629mg [Xenopus laevis]|nr:hypothetical protein XELAEV_18001629mg [Xenopus laevis]